MRTLVCDDAPQFKLLTEELALCWVHEGRHYKKLNPLVAYHQQQAKFSPEQQFVGDKAYVGAARTTTPTKKPKGRELTTEQQEENKEISSRRIFIEHLIRRLKIFRIASEKFRLNPKHYKTVILTICGLVRLRLGTFSFSS